MEIGLRSSRVESLTDRNSIDEIKDFLSTHKFDYVFRFHSPNRSHLYPVSRHAKGRSKEDAYKAYWKETLAMVESGLFKYIGHLDYIKSMRSQAYGRFEFEEWLPEITEILEKVIETGAILEANTSALRRTYKEPYPGWGILELYKSLGGTHIVMGSELIPVPGGPGFRKRKAAQEMGLVICDGTMLTSSSQSMDRWKAWKADSQIA